MKQNATNILYKFKYFNHNLNKVNREATDAVTNKINIQKASPTNGN